MKNETVKYQIDQKDYLGYIAYPEQQGPRPVVILAHPWRGLDDFVQEKAHELAKMGYVGFAADLYGDGITATSDQQASTLMLPLFLNRVELQKRIVAAYHTASQNPTVNPRKVAAIGFCFGGLTVIELLRSGVALSAVVTFHGLLGDHIGEHHAARAPKNKINGSILIQHGHDDPLVSSADIAAIQKEFTEAAIDWQMHIYGHTTHAFTNPQANDPNNGTLRYNPVADHRSWIAMANFLEEKFAK